MLDGGISTPVGEINVIANRDGDSLVARRLDRPDILAADDDRRRPDTGPSPVIIGVAAVAGRSTQSLVPISAAPSSTPRREERQNILDEERECIISEVFSGRQMTTTAATPAARRWRPHREEEGHHRHQGPGFSLAARH